MRKTYLNIYKRYAPIILAILIIMMLSGICTRKKIYNKDFSKLKDNVIVIDEDNTRLSKLVKDVIKTKNNIIEVPNEIDSANYLQNGKAKAVYIIQKDLQKEFFESAEKNSKVISKVVEHYGLSREKTAGLSVGNLLEHFNFDLIDRSEYGKKYSKDEKGQTDFINDLEKQILNKENEAKKYENLHIDFTDFSENKIMFEENKINIFFIMFLMGAVVLISSFVKVKILNKSAQKYLKEKGLYNKEVNKKILKSILPIDILFVHIYTIFSVMIAWLSNINALNTKDMLAVLGIYYLLTFIIYIFSFIFVVDKTKEKSNKKKNKK